MGTVSPIRPAKVDWNGPSPEYSPRIPWKAISIALLVLLVLGGGYYYQSHRETEATRAKIHALYAKEVAPVAKRLKPFRLRLSRWILQASAKEPKDTVAAGWSLNQLREKKSLYLRVIAPEPIKDQSQVVDSLPLMGRDAIGRCLGIHHVSARTLFEDKEFLTPRWLKAVDETEQHMRLRVFSETLARRISSDVPVYEALMDESEYFLLAVQRGPSRKNTAVDFWAFALPSGKEIFSLRAKGAGRVIHAQIGNPSTKGSKVPSPADDLGALDCSIANQLRGLLSSTQ